MRTIENKNILVFGGTGLIGTALIKELKKYDNTVTNISLKNESPYADKNIKMNLAQVTLSEIESICKNDFKTESYDEVFYLATYSTSDKMNKMQLMNEATTLEYICRTFKHSRISYASSYAVHDKTIYPKGDVKNAYKVAKMNSERVLEEHINNFRNIRVFRIPAVYGGSDNDRALYRVAKKIQNNIDVVINKDEISFQYLDEVVDYLISDEEGFIDIQCEVVNFRSIVNRLKIELNSTSNITEVTDISQSEIDLIEELLDSLNTEINTVED